MATAEGPFMSTASQGITSGADLILPASAFVDERQVRVQGAFPNPYHTYYVSVGDVQLPRLGGMVSPDGTSVRVAQGAELEPSTPIAVGAKITQLGPRSNVVPSSGNEWMKWVHER